MKSITKVCSVLAILALIALCFGCFSVPSVSSPKMSGSFDLTDMVTGAVTKKIVSTVPIYSFELDSGEKIDVFAISDLNDAKGTWTTKDVQGYSAYAGNALYGDFTITYPSKGKNKNLADLTIHYKYDEYLTAGAYVYMKDGMTEQEAKDALWKDILNENKDNKELSFTKGAPYECTETTTFDIEDSVGMSKDKKYLYLIGYSAVFVKAK